jgi:MarR family transcriptional regulator, temperature-dependent positive regulator of motility
VDQLPPPAALLTAPGFVARRLHHAYTAAWQRHVDPVLTGPQFAVLTAVDAYPGVEQGSLARTVALDRSTMASIAKRLEERGLITRATSPADGRKRLLHLTAEGRETMAAARARIDELDRLLMARVPTEAALLVELNGIAEHWESLSEEAG